ncbi:MAG: hypothetical protein J6563_00925 [Gilliamella sp.]|uniref:hypothetical protein n=1 Tax=Gilliamella sp. TaxID=1891236 RepID=UPI00260D9B1F|nr:hypothetical protein [Gilliamella sp.]MCO6551525.1 hypothetical protein [Gilliamella sp.]
MNDKNEFIDFIVNKLPSLGIVSDSTSNNLRIVVLRVKGYIPEVAPYTSWDIDSIIDVFSKNENISESATIGYKTRLRSAISKFDGFKNGNLSKLSKSPKNKVTTPDGPAMQVLNIANTFALPIPLREGLILNISNLPLDLTEDEAEKITRIIKSYAVIKN